jgi:hypothetical protein
MKEEKSKTMIEHCSTKDCPECKKSWRGITESNGL